MSAALTPRVPTIPFNDQRYLTYCGQRLRQARKARGWSQEEAGLRIGMSGNAISQLEKGEQWMRNEKLLHLAFVLDVDPRDLYPPAPDDPCAAVSALLHQRPPEMTHALTQFLLRVFPESPCLLPTPLDP